ncbi:hypothetical protein UPYG_G00052980 [Umbra pygmaea]|uniref:C2H2-type domain-containing protein n=1 Tax=Umbra pygmaea TaxID=75934 RepID=A0ABD0X7L4_UMBPY
MDHGSTLGNTITIPDAGQDLEMDLTGNFGSELLPEKVQCPIAHEPNVIVKEEESEEDMADHILCQSMAESSGLHMVIKEEKEDDEEEDCEEEEDLPDLHKSRGGRIKLDPDYLPDDGIEPIGQPDQQKKKKPVRKLHPCAECGKTFDRPSHLERHEKTHTRIKKMSPDYPCSFCGKTFYPVYVS